MPDSRFDDLLRRFQEAYAQFSREPFLIIWLKRKTFQEKEVDAGTWLKSFVEQKDKGWSEWLGFIPSGSSAPDGNDGWKNRLGYDVFGLVYYAEPHWERSREPLDHFCELAALAGASLPLDVRSKIPCIPSDAIGWWLAYLWHQQPPTDDQRVEFPGLSRCIRTSPFLESAEAIERGGLAAASIPTPMVQQGPAINQATANVTLHLRQVVLNEEPSRDGPVQPEGQAHVEKSREQKDPIVPKRGRPSDTDRKADARIADAWDSGSYKDFSELGRAFGKSRTEVRLAIDRHRKRQNR